jgi:hypothetical protein
MRCSHVGTEDTIQGDCKAVLAMLLQESDDDDTVLAYLILRQLSTSVQDSPEFRCADVLAAAEDVHVGNTADM